MNNFIITMVLKIRYLSWLNLMVLFLTVYSCNDNKNNPAFQITDPCESASPTPDSLRYIPVHEKPVITSPKNNTIFPIIYGDEFVEIKWESPKDLVSLELEYFIEYFKLDHPYDCLDYEKFHRFWSVNDNDVVDKGNRSFSNYIHRHYYWLPNEFYHPYDTNDSPEIITDTVYVAYRMRSKSSHKNYSLKYSLFNLEYKYSLWTDVKTFAMVPLVNLKKNIIEVSYHFNFIAEETNEFYFSGIAKANNYRLKNMASDNHLNLDKIRSIRAVKFVTDFVSGNENNKNAFSLIAIGFNEDYQYKKVFCPFEIIGSVSPSSKQENRPIEGQLLATYNSNFLSQLNDYDLKLAYKLEDDPGTAHDISVTLTYEVFSDH